MGMTRSVVFYGWSPTPLELQLLINAVREDDPDFFECLKVVPKTVEELVNLGYSDFSDLIESLGFRVLYSASASVPGYFVGAEMTTLGETDDLMRDVKHLLERAMELDDPYECLDPLVRANLKPPRLGLTMRDD